MTDTVYESLIKEGWEYFLEKHDERSFHDFLDRRHPCIRVAMVLSILKERVDKGGFDLLFRYYRLDRDKALVDLFAGVLHDIQRKLPDEDLPKVMVILWDNAGMWYENVHPDRDKKMQDLDDRFAAICGDEGSEWDRCAEAYLFLLEQQYGRPQEKRF